MRLLQTGHTTLIILNEIGLTTLALALVLYALAVALRVGIHIHVVQTALHISHGEDKRSHTALQRVSRVIHEGLLTEGHIVRSRLEVLRRLNRACVLRAAHLRHALKIHRHILLLTAEENNATSRKHILAEGDAHLHVARQVLLEVLRGDHRDGGLHIVCILPPVVTLTNLRCEVENISRAALAAAGAQHDSRGEEHLVLLVAHERDIEDGDAHLIEIDHHVI